MPFLHLRRSGNQAGGNKKPRAKAGVWKNDHRPFSGFLRGRKPVGSNHHDRGGQ
jgi:hypothetical protein